MKKVVALLLAMLMLLCSAAAMADVKIGQVEFAAHGTKCFAVLTAVVDGDTIVAAYIDEFQVMSGAEGVPNGENMFADLATNGQVLASKRVNNGLYSTNMLRAGSTRPLGANYDAIQAYVVGKTIDELAAEIEGKTSAEMVDAVSSCTLADTLGYVTGLLEAAKAASLENGYYTVNNVTGEAVTEVTFTDNATGEVLAQLADIAADAAKVAVVTAPHGTSMTMTFKTEGGYEASFATLHIETAPIYLLAADALTGATAISFRAPAKAE